jgi:hypothetical protein
MSRARPSALVVFLCACGASPRLDGVVVDIWGNPVEGALVKLEGFPDRPVSDGHGRFSLPYAPGTHVLKAGREGYIQEDLQITIPDDPAAAPEVVFRLYPIPVEKGFHVVGADGYVKLEAKPVRALGNNLRSLYGVQEVGTASVDGTDLRFVYHGDLRQDQLMALGISLHRLEFVPTAELVGITATTVPLNLYVSDLEVPLAIERLKSRNDYLLRSEEVLEPQAIYALTTNDLLTPPDDESFRAIAPALRVAFPVELR